MAHFIIRLSTLAFTLMAVGCVGAKALQAETSGHVGCVPEQIAISDSHYNWHHRSWTAVCGDKLYFCRVSSSGDSSCAERVTPASEPRVPTVVAYAGDWQRAEFGLCPGSALLPGTPEDTEVPELAAQKGLEARGFQVKSGDRGFVVTAIRASEAAPDWDRVLDATIASTVEGLDGHLAAKKRLSGRSGYSALVNLPNGKGQLLAQVFHEGPCLYVAEVAPRARVAESDLVRFFSGLHVSSEPAEAGRKHSAGIAILEGFGK